MKTYEILPTDKNLVQTLIDDTIGRDSDVFRFVNILNSIDCSYSVALDGRWGSGKTFFVKFLFHLSIFPLSRQLLPKEFFISCSSVFYTKIRL